MARLCLLGVIVPARKTPPKSLPEVVATGDHRAALEAMRDSLAIAMDRAEPAVIAQISGRLQAVLAELAGMATDREESAASEFARKRAARIADADAAASAPKRKNVRRS